MRRGGRHKEEPREVLNVGEEASIGRGGTGSSVWRGGRHGELGRALGKVGMRRQRGEEVRRRSGAVRQRRREEVHAHGEIIHGSCRSRKLLKLVSLITVLHFILFSVFHFGGQKIFPLERG